MWFQDVGAPSPRTVVPSILIWESCGSVPAMPIGSFWRDQVRVEAPASCGPRNIDFVLDAGNQWSVVRAADPRPAERTGGPSLHCWINPSDFPLTLSDQHRERVPAFQSLVVPARTVDGTEVILPCYEVFRAFYAGTSELAVKLLTAPWDAAAVQKIMAAATVEGTSATPEWRISLLADNTQTAIRYLAHLVLDPVTRRAAASIYPHLAHSRQFELEDPWLRVTPPFRNQRVKVRARVRSLASRGAVIVEEILEVHYPAAVAAIHVVVPSGTVVVPSDSQADDKAVTGEDGNESEFRIGAAIDRRSGIRATNLGTASPIWINAPEVKRSASQTRLVTKSLDETKSESKVPTSVSVGADGRSKVLARGSISAHAAQELHDRFSALHATLLWLENSGLIAAWESVPLVDPCPPEAPRYCAFPQQPANRPGGWAEIDRSHRRARMAWVLELRTQSNTMYWIESEASKTADVRCSLCFRTLKEVQLTAPLLRRLLGICAENKGVWPTQPPPSLAHDVVWKRIRHRFQGDKVHPSTITGAIDELSANCT